MMDADWPTRLISMSNEPPQRVVVPTQATIDASMLEYINEIAGFVPEEVRDEFWGFANRMQGMARVTPRQAEAVILRAQNLVDLSMMAMPQWKITPGLILKGENFIAFVKMQVWRAVSLDPTNERGQISRTPAAAGAPMPSQEVPMQRKPAKPFWKFWS